MRSVFTMLMSVFIAALLITPLTSYAGTATVTVTYPTANTDGSSIPATGAGSIASIRVEYGTCAGTAFGTKGGETTVNAPATSVVFTLSPGDYCFRAFASNTYGRESAASNVAPKTVPAPTPNPPTVVTVATVAYEVRTNNGSVWLAKTGKVALGVTCGSHMSGDYYFLEASQVDLNGSYRGGAIVGICAGM